MADTGWLTPTDFITDSGVGDYDWADPENAGSDDGRYSTVDLGTGNESYYLGVRAFDAALPSGATVDGIEVRIDRNASRADCIRDNRLYVGASPGGSSNLADGVTLWPEAVDGTVTYGGPTELWGLTPSWSDINDSGWAVWLTAYAEDGTTANVDMIQMRVYYTEAAPPSGLGTGNFFLMF